MRTANDLALGSSVMRAERRAGDRYLQGVTAGETARFMREAVTVTIIDGLRRQAGRRGLRIKIFHHRGPHQMEKKKVITEIDVKNEVDIKTLVIEVPVSDEDIAHDFPLREGNVWKASVDIDDGCIAGWPEGYEGELYLKVVDQGTYKLLDKDSEVIIELSNDYVPNNLIPGEYGDYIELHINGSGKITNWPSSPSFEDFFEE